MKTTESKTKARASRRTAPRCSLSVRTVGHSMMDRLYVDTWEGFCGGEDGVGFRHDRNAPWLIPYTEMDKLVTAYAKFRKANTRIADTGGANAAIEGGY